MIDDARRSFRQGVLVGIGGAVIAAYVWMLAQMGSLLDMYKDMGNSRLPRASSVVLTSRWPWALPIVGAGIVGWLIVKRPRGLVPYVALVAVFGVALLVTRYLAYLPIFELAGNIRD